MAARKTIEIGSRVAYSAKFLRSIACYTGALPHARGTVTALKSYGGNVALATIQWDAKADELPERVAVANLAIVGTAAMNAQ